MAQHHKDKSKNEGILEIIIVFLAMIVALVGVVWLLASNRIVWYSLNPALFLASMWKWIPSEFAILKWNTLVRVANEFAAAPADVGIFRWLTFINTAALPFAVLVFLAYLPVPIWILARKRISVTRVIKPNVLLEHNLKTFTGIAPVLKIRKKIVENKLPQWRIQVSPEEIFSGKAGNRSMISSGEFDVDVAREYFMGIVPDKGVDGRLMSRMIGRQIVNLLVDRTSEKPIVFTDRLSAEGKVLMGLWAAVAFGGDEGKDDYCKYRDLLNLSAYGSPTGLANLTVAEPIFKKYRANKKVAQLFAVHHWEHTFLFALLEIAQRRGRYTTAEVLWLRPTNRIMFFSLNACGAKTPHPEAASTFSQFGYERTCAALNRLPLAKDPSGKLVHVISIDRCVDGLRADYDHWVASTDDDRDWWNNANLWRARDGVLKKYLLESQKTVVPPVPAGEESAFDAQQRAARESISQTEEQHASDELGRVFNS